MADLIKEANFLRYYYTSDDAVKDKDYLKDKAYQTYCSKQFALFTLPIAFQVWQISLANH